MTDQQLRMRAYYYSFQLTGEPEIDLILSAVASAGKSFHHTDQWNEEVSPEEPHTGNSPVDWIRNAATLAAQISKQTKTENDQLRAEVAGLKTGYEAYERVNAELKAENEALRANSSLVVLLPELDSALEDLEIHGQHSDHGYRSLKDWYRKIDLACKAIDAAMGKGEQS